METTMKSPKIGQLIGVDGSKGYTHGCKDSGILRYIGDNQAVCVEAHNCTSCWQVGHDDSHVFMVVGQIYFVENLQVADDDWTVDIAYQMNGQPTPAKSMMESKLSPATEAQLAQKEIERIDREQAEYDRNHSEPTPPAPAAKLPKLSAAQDKALETYWRTFLKGEEIHTNTIGVRDTSRDAIVKAGLLQRYLRNNERAGWPKIKFMQFTPAGIAYCEARFGRDMLAKEQAAERL